MNSLNINDSLFCVDSMHRTIKSTNICSSSFILHLLKSKLSCVFYNQKPDLRMKISVDNNITLTLRARESYKRHFWRFVGFLLYTVTVDGGHGLSSFERDAHLCQSECNATYLNICKLYWVYIQCDHPEPSPCVNVSLGSPTGFMIFIYG